MNEQNKDEYMKKQEWGPYTYSYDLKNKSTAKSPEDILKLLQQIKMDFDKLTRQVKQLTAQEEVEAFFEIPETKTE